MDKPNSRAVDAVPTEIDVKKQYFVALMNNNPANWRAIESKFPPSDPENIHYNVKAWIHLAWIGLEHDNMNEAAEAAAKILQPRTSMTADSVSRVLALVIQAMVKLHNNNPKAADAKMLEAKMLNENLSPEEKDMVKKAMPWSVYNQWLLPIEIE